MESLSNDILKIVLKKMTMSDRIKMRRVSKRFLELVDQQYGHISEVVVASDYIMSRNRWFLHEDLIDLQEQVFVAFRLTYPSPMLNKLMRLKFRGNLEFADFIRLHRFPELEALEIGCLSFDSRLQRVQFPSLRFLYVAAIDGRKNLGCLVIEADELIAVYFGEDSINYIRPVNAETVIWLEFHEDDPERRDSLRYTKARFVKCNQILDLDMNILLGLFSPPFNAEKYVFNVQDLTNLSLPPYTDLCKAEADQRMQFIYKVLLLQKHKRDESDAQKMCDVYLNYVLIHYDLPYPHLLLDKLLFLHVLYFPRLMPKINQLRAIDYDEVMRNVQSFPPMNLVITYPNISQITLKKRQSPLPPNQVLSFLSHYNPMAIQYLTIEFCGFPQDFFDSLPLLVRSLTNLQILDSVQIEFDFLCRFEWLHSFSTNLMSKRMVLDKIDRLNYKSMFEFFMCNQNSFSIYKVKPNEYELAIRENVSSENVAPETSSPIYELIDPCFVQEHFMKGLTYDLLHDRLSEDFPVFAHWFDV